ncbi:hemolysin III [Philodulcilactobacillus myokoensis]|uniref:Hemolysin III n=1 Tax=Philodulcilactobacillus myokoensis TaxID=2929573 RepID=A0A9W6ESS7_9LACO|nr:hemolysin III family protein [Philodulcilactobacillus myokoensis]GLB46449.1 hemolysin III [Philodulcilactobacillus myokoensis]
MISKRTYQILDEIFSAITHGLGAFAAILGAIFLIVHGVHEGGFSRIISYSIYSVILVLFYFASTLFHSLYFTPAEKVFQIFDHSFIYLLIAATYTPYCLVTIKGTLGITILSVIWIMAILGVIYKCLWMGKFKTLSTIIYVVMGWMCVLGLKPLIVGLTWHGFLLLLIGGIIFTVGAVIYSFKQIWFGHVIWHIFVLAGTILMYFSIYFYV